MWATVIRFCVRVPVLSEQIVEVDPENVWFFKKMPCSPNQEFRRLRDSWRDNSCWPFAWQSESGTQLRSRSDLQARSPRWYLENFMVFKMVIFLVWKSMDFTPKKGENLELAFNKADLHERLLSFSYSSKGKTCQSRKRQPWASDIREWRRWWRRTLRERRPLQWSGGWSARFPWR